MEDEELIPFMFNGKAVLSADIEWLHVEFKSASDGYLSLYYRKTKWQGYECKYKDSIY